MRQRTALLFGNGPHGNLGCQAIDIGTACGLSQAGFDNGVFMPMGRTFDSALIQAAGGLRVELDLSAGERARSTLTRGTAKVLRSLPAGWRPRPLAWVLGDVATRHDFDIAMALGGDNYTLDYGPPDVFFGLNRTIEATGRPLVMWGASIGPFDADRAYEAMAARELARVSRVFAREDVTVEYLQGLGLNDLVSRVSDPAFLMEPVSPPAAPWMDRLPGSIALNLSPLIGQKLSLGAEEWVGRTANSIRELLDLGDRDVILVSHVELEVSDDRKLLQAAADALTEAEAARVVVVPRGLNAQEVKWVLGKVAVFAGARTHATIASISQAVPTVSIGYSAKSVGVNLDAFGDARWVVDLKTFSPERLAERVAVALAEKDDVTKTLTQRLPAVRARSRAAFSELAEIVQART